MCNHFKPTSRLVFATLFSASKLALLLLAVAAPAVAFIDCGAPILHPKVGPGTDYPCGLNSKSCGNHMCCWNNEVCGCKGLMCRCEEGMCCNDGNEFTYGSRPQHAQFAEPTTSMQQ